MSQHRVAETSRIDRCRLAAWLAGAASRGTLLRESAGEPATPGPDVQPRSNVSHHRADRAIVLSPKEAIHDCETISSGTGAPAVLWRHLPAATAASRRHRPAGLILPELLRAGTPAAAAPASAARAGGGQPSCIFIFQYGGASHLDSWDPKPAAPLRSVAPISRSPPRCRVCGSANCSLGWPCWRTGIVLSAR